MESRVRSWRPVEPAEAGVDLGVYGHQQLGDVPEAIPGVDLDVYGHKQLGDIPEAVPGVDLGVLWPPAARRRS